MASDLVCPQCGNPDHQVKDSRPANGAIRRRRFCPQCGLRFSTFERVEQAWDYNRYLTLIQAYDALAPKHKKLVNSIIGELAGIPAEAQTDEPPPSTEEESNEQPERTPERG